MASEKRHEGSGFEAILAKYREQADGGRTIDGRQLLAELAEEADRLRDGKHSPRRFPVEPTAAFEPPSSAASNGTGNHAAETVSRPLVPDADTYTSPLAPADDAHRPADLPDYELLFEIARGGMGVVYKARQRSLNRVVAVKMIRSGELASPQEVARFHAEAEAAANLRHPNIVTIYEVGRAGPGGDRHYFSMDLIEGRNLAQVARDESLTAERTAEYMLAIARAIEYAHQHGILHRDLKPSNVLVDDDDQPRVTDFGLAKRLEGDSNLTASGSILGSPSYMPPEQAAGDPSRMGPASDVYSLGAILYELLTGRPPFRGETPIDTILQVLDDEPIAPSQLQRSVSSDLETICLKCLQKDPRQRYASAAELAGDLDRFLRGEPIEARPIGRFERTMKWCRRRPAVASLIGVVVAATIVLLAGGAWYNARLRAALGESTEQRGLAEDRGERLQVALIDAESQQRIAEQKGRDLGIALGDARNNLYAVKIKQAQGYLDQPIPHMARAIELLESLKPQPGQPDLRGPEWHHLWRFCHWANASFRLHTIYAMRWLSDDRVLLVTQDDIVEVQGQETRLVADLSKSPASTFHGACIANDGRTIAFVTGKKTIVVMDITDETKPREFEPTGLKNARTIAVSPDGARVALAEPDGRLQIWSVPTGRRLHELPADPAHGWRMVFSPDGKRLATCGSASYVKVYDVEDLSVAHQQLDEHVGRVFGIDFAPDGSTLATAGRDSKLILWDPESGKMLQKLTFTCKNWLFQSLAWSPSGRQLAMGTRNSILVTLDLDTLEARSLKGHYNDVDHVAFSTDGRHVASASGQGMLKIWDVADEQGHRVVDRRKACLLNCLAWSPDGRLLVYGGDNLMDEKGAGLFVWDQRTNKRLHEIPITPVASIAFSPDSTAFVAIEADTVNQAGGNAYVYSATSGERLETIRAPQTRILQAHFTTDESLILGCENGAVYYWDRAANKLRETSMNQQADVIRATLTSDRRTLITRNLASQIEVWDLKTDEQLFTVDGTTGIVEVAASPDGRYFAWSAPGFFGSKPPAGDAYRDRPLRYEQHFDLVDAVTFETRFSLEGHTDAIRSLVFMPDGRRLLSGSSDGTIKFWDTATGLEVATLRHPGPVTALAPSPDGKQLATISLNRNNQSLVWIRPMR